MLPLSRQRTQRQRPNSTWRASKYKEHNSAKGTPVECCYLPSSVDSTQSSKPELVSDDIIGQKSCAKPASGNTCTFCSVKVLQTVNSPALCAVLLPSLSSKPISKPHCCDSGLVHEPHSYLCISFSSNPPHPPTPIPRL